MTKKVLYILSSSFPFGDKEPLIQIEVQALCNELDEVIVLSSEKISEKKYELPSNGHAYYFPAKTNVVQKLLFSFQLFFSKLFWDEIKTIRFTLNLKFSKEIFKTILSAYAEARWFKKQVRKLQKNLGLYSAENYYYAWWSRYQSIGFSMLKVQDKKAKFFLRMHGYDLYFERHQPAYLPFRKLLFDRANAVLFISEQGKNYIQKKFNHGYTNHHVARLGTKNEHELPPFIESKKINVVSCSNLIPLKRVHAIIDALAVIDQNISISWVHFGTGPLLNDLEKLAHQKLDVKPNVNFDFKGFIKNSDLHLYYCNHQVDLLINVSETEGIPISIIEANSFSIPAIATDVGGVSEIVSNDNGYLIDPQNVIDSLIEALNSYISLSIEQKTALRKNARSKWKADFNSESNIHHLMTILNDKNLGDGN